MRAKSFLQALNSVKDALHGLSCTIVSRELGRCVLSCAVLSSPKSSLADEGDHSISMSLSADPNSLSVDPVQLSKAEPPVKGTLLTLTNGVKVYSCFADEKIWEEHVRFFFFLSLFFFFFLSLTSFFCV